MGKCPSTHVVLRQLVNGHLGLQQVAVEGDNLMAQCTLFFLIVLPLEGRGGRRRWSEVSAQQLAEAPGFPWHLAVMRCLED